MVDLMVAMGEEDSVERSWWKVPFIFLRPRREREKEVSCAAFIIEERDGCE